MECLVLRMRYALMICCCLLGVSNANAGPLALEPRHWKPFLVLESADMDLALSEQVMAAAGNAGLSPGDWTALALELIVKYERNAVRSGRLLGYLHVAMHDAAVIAAQKGLSRSQVEVSAYLAAAEAMTYLFPLEAEARFEHHAGAGLARAYPNHWPRLMDDSSSARQVAKAVGEALHRRARNDGAERVWPISERPVPFPGMFEGTPPLFAFNPLEVSAGSWLTWVEGSGTELDIMDPLEYDSTAFHEALDEVIQVARSLTAEQLNIAEKWHLDAGSITPVGKWNRYVLEVIEEQQLDSLASLRLLALLNVAMADATIACWQVKYHWWTLRPVTAAQQRGDVDFKPALATPQHPSYVSGHATASGAAAQILGALLPVRLESFDAMAEEAAMSRLYGGIHYRHDNDQGLRLGRLVGSRVLEASGITLLQGVVDTN